MVGILKEALVWNGTLYKGLFPNLYIQGAGLDLAWRCPSRWLLTQHWFRAWVGGPSIHPSIESSNSLSEILPPRISCHASCFSESVPSVSQSIKIRHQEREEPLLSVRPVSSFMQFPRPSIDHASIQSAHSERKKRSSLILFLNQNVYQLIPIHSVKVSTAFSRPST